MIKGIVICQPYASAIIEGIKLIENRTWKTNYRGKLAIIAGKSREWMSGINKKQMSLLEPVSPFDSLPFGMLLGYVDLVDIQLMSSSLASNPWAFGPYCWILEKPLKLNIPIQFRGQQGLFDVSPEIKR